MSHFLLRLFNTLAKKKQTIQTIAENELKIYVCGPTVYDFVHLGNARSFVFYDLLYRLCKALYTNVIYVRNITDIDDKIIAKAHAEGVDESDVTKKYIDAFWHACKFLNCQTPTHEPKVSDNIDEIILIINNLLARGHAYYSGDDIYFSVESFKDYGKLSGRKIEDMIAGARLEVDKNKKHPADFVLWKGKPKTATQNKNEISFKAKFYIPKNAFFSNNQSAATLLNANEQTNDLKNQVEIGKGQNQFAQNIFEKHFNDAAATLLDANEQGEAKFLQKDAVKIDFDGRPGWHIECSAMSYRYLGGNFDIHGGGIDLQFPHHENEIAQSVCAFDGCQYAKYWVHNGFLMINGAKMSKSDGNFITIQNLIDKGYHGEVVRLALLSTHYAKPLDFSDSLLLQTKKVLDKFYETTCEYQQDFNLKHAGGSENKLFSLLPDTAKDAITDDINISRYVAIMHTLVNDIKHTVNDKQGRQNTAYQLLAMGHFIGIMQDLNYLDNENKNDDKSYDKGNENYQKALTLAKQRIESKKMKDFKTADELRHKVLNLGYKIVDLPNGDFNLEVV